MSQGFPNIPPKVLWWGRFDPDYSRNRILHQLLEGLGWKSSYFQPYFSRFGDLEATFNNLGRPDLLWVPCFRQRDLAAAVRWGKRHSVPVVFDPLISAYDKQVFERKKLLENSSKAKRLLAWETDLFQQADLVLADTCEHARFFVETLGVTEQKVAVVPVGAEESLFKPKSTSHKTNSPLTVLFYGSFLNLQGPEVIVRAAQLYQGPPIQWKMVGDGPLLESCKKVAAGMDNLEFIPWVPYEELPELIQSADILLGVFGTTSKAGRVIPNKVYQALACGKQLLTRYAPSYPETIIRDNDSGIRWVPPGDPEALAESVRELAEHPHLLAEMGRQARQTYENNFSLSSISQALGNALELFLDVKE